MKGGSLLFHYPELYVGGAQLSSLRMMAALADRGWRITLILDKGGGALEPIIDPRIEVIRLYASVTSRPLAHEGRFPRRRFYGIVRRRVWDMTAKWRASLLRFRKFDAAVCLQMHAISPVVREIARASVRIIWVRTDLALVDPTGRIMAALRGAVPWADHFVCVSAAAQAALISSMPETAHKAKVIHNILAPESIRQSSRGPDPLPPRQAGELRILSVCRLVDRQKGLLRMVRIAAKLANAGQNFRWYIIGDGRDRSAFQASVEAAGLSHRMILLGEVLNPLPAYVAADIVAMLSYYEGLSGVVNEARVLARPLIATEVAGISEQLEDGTNALVVPQDEDAITQGMERLLRDENLRLRLAAGGYPAALLEDDAKLAQMEELFRGRTTPAQT